jgi:hypothetical protein
MAGTVDSRPVPVADDVKIPLREALTKSYFDLFELTEKTQYSPGGQSIDVICAHGTSKKGDSKE